MTKFISFDDALQSTNQKHMHILLGNGFSMSYERDIFAYSALFEKANFDGLSKYARNAFDQLGTTNFETVIKALLNSSTLTDLYETSDKTLSKRFLSDAEGLKDVLVKSIAGNHPDLPISIPITAYQHCKKFLSHFEKFYSTNYDLLLYWTLMQDIPEFPIKHLDGFHTPKEGPNDYVVWDMGQYKQNLFYLHGALHLFDTDIELQKYTWINTGIPLIQQIRSALNDHKYPLFVAEGTSNQKVAKIRHSDYLSRCLRSFREIGGTLFVYGFSFSENDKHITRQIETNSKLKQLFISIYGDPNSQSNQSIINNVEAIQYSRREGYPIEIHFFDANTAQVWR